jgi:hypothetical protein
MRLFKREPLEFVGEKAKKALENFKTAFPDYEIEYLVAELEVKIPHVGKGSLKVKMRENRKQNIQETEVVAELEGMKPCLKS